MHRFETYVKTTPFDCTVAEELKTVAYATPPMEQRRKKDKKWMSLKLHASPHTGNVTFSPDFIFTCCEPSVGKYLSPGGPAKQIAEGTGERGRG